MPKISIIIPIYKPKYERLRLTFDSIKSLEYDDIEIILVVDSKTSSIDFETELSDSTKYFRLFYKEHSGVSDTVNIGLNESLGEYIFLLNQYDIINLDRINLALKEFNNNENLSVLSNSMFYRSSVVIRKSILPCMPYWFEQYYAPCDIEKFVITCKLHNIETKIIEDDINKTNYKVSNKHSRNQKRLKRLIKQISQSTENNILTCIIPFKNEGCEVEKTINSIYATTENTSIIVINDNSDDSYYYDDLQEIYPHIKYIKNTKTIGHGNIDLGVINSDTKYCILIDAHMRFYEDNWDKRICNFLENNKNSIIYGFTTIIEKNQNGTYKNEDCSEKTVKTCGAGVNLNTDSELHFMHFWAYNDKLNAENEVYKITPNILGACYCFSKEWYNYIGGTYGLSQYGLSEACLAVKTWLMGGKCYRIQDFYVGHIYRKTFPYTIKSYSCELNRRFLVELYVDNNEDKIKYFNTQQKYLEKSYNTFLNEWNNLYEKVESYIKHYRSKFVMTLDNFRENINSKFI